MDRTTIYLSDADRQAIAHIKQGLGIKKAADVIRVALRLTAASVLSEEEWRRVSSGESEIQRGDYLTLPDLKRRLAL